MGGCRRRRSGGGVRGSSRASRSECRLLQGSASAPGASVHSKRWVPGPSRSYSSYQPVADEQVTAVLRGGGLRRAEAERLRCSSATAHHTSHERLTPAPAWTSDGPQDRRHRRVGTRRLRPSRDAGRTGGRPACCGGGPRGIWHALRETASQDMFPHFGTLLRDHGGRRRRHGVPLRCPRRDEDLCAQRTCSSKSGDRGRGSLSYASGIALPCTGPARRRR